MLARLDRKLCHFEGEITATVIYAVTEAPFDTLLICTAGHPPPLIARHGQRRAQEAQLPAGLILGIDPDRERQSHELFLEQDAALVFYTDGLVERAGTISAQPYEWRERLDLVCQAFQSAQDAETICSRVIAIGLGDESVEDDVAVVAMRRTSSTLRLPVSHTRPQPTHPTSDVPARGRRDVG